MTEPVGSIAEETARLAGALEDWLRGRAAGGRSEGDGQGPGVPGDLLGRLGDLIAVDTPECRLCPLCQLLGGLRSVRPETTEHLLEAVTALLAAVRSAVDTEPGPRRTSRVEHIDVS